MNKFLVALMSFLVSCSVFAAEGFSSLEEQMTGKEFSSAGLDKLSQSELDSLNGWIRAHSLATLAPAKPASGNSVSSSGDDAGEAEPEAEQERTTITSNLVGKFSGWDGQTTFKLRNGQVWVQSDKDKFYTKEIQNPVVVIEPAMFGTWRLRVEGFDEDCRVKRIQ